MPVYGNTDINDIRTQPQFRGYSFSKFKKTEVRNHMVDNMRKGKVEPAIYWCAELVCAGHYLDVWETIMSFFAKYIHLANPRLAVYLAMRFSIFKNIVSQGLYTSELQLRNNGDVRRIFAEVVCNLALSPKKPAFESVKINRVEEFDMTQMPERLKADSTKYIEPIWEKEDPKEMTISVNEFAYHVDHKNMIQACYWIEWMVEFNQICNNRKEPTKCQRRGYGVDNKYSREIIWLVWDVLIHYASETKNAFIMKTMDSTNELFCARYTTATCKKRRYLLYFAVSLLTETVSAAIPIVTNHEVMTNVVSQIDNIYSQIKENEHSPNTDYLFNGMDAETNFLRTVQRMEMMNNTDMLM
jgi:hypothetical protein